MKRLISLLLVLVMLLGTLAACGGGNTETTKPLSQNENENNPPEDEPSDIIPSDLNFSHLTNKEDKTVRFFVRTHIDQFKNEIDCSSTATGTVDAAVYRRNRYVENKLGVTIVAEGINGNDMTSVRLWNQQLRNFVLSNGQEYDAASIYLSQSAGLSLENTYANVLDTTYIRKALKENKPYWNKTITDQLTYLDTLYFLAGDITISQTNNASVLYFNKDLYADKFGSTGKNLHQLVRDYKWTIQRHFW